MLLGIDPCGRIAAFESQPDSAAHSMDTDWYAVDRDGHVGQLWSGEEGAVPWEAHKQFWSQLFEDLAVARIETLIATTPATGRVIALDREVHAIEPGDVPYTWNGVLRFASREYLDLFRAEQYPDWRVLDDETHVVVVKDILRTAFTDYWAADAIACAYVIGELVPPRAIGLFEYRCGFSGPYHREAVPAVPMLLDSLPPALQAKLGSLRISKFGFDTTTRFDPTTFLRCHVYPT